MRRMNMQEPAELLRPPKNSLDSTFKDNHTYSIAEIYFYVADFSLWTIVRTSSVAPTFSVRLFGPLDNFSALQAIHDVK